ncbi:MAG: hypothetical protein GY787_22480 [Alteromonadales bacterium]|nr:hypothetical protein [Alteromonadales bacterium]
MRILFIGNSHTYFHGMPFQCRELLQHLGIQSQITMIAQPGETLLWHAENPATKLALRYDSWDHIILQQAAHPFAGATPLCEGIGKLLNMIPATDNHKSPAIWLSNTWCEQASPENQLTIDHAFKIASKKFCLPIITVSDAWHEVERQDNGFELYHVDGEHAGRGGSYLSALCITRALTGKSVTGLPNNLRYNGKIINRVSPSAAQCYQYVVDKNINH